MNNTALYLTNSSGPPHHLEKFVLDFNIPIVESLDESNDILIWDGELLSYESKDRGRISFDFIKEWRRHTTGKQMKRGPLAKALGIKGDEGKIIWDLTCGTGKDSILLLSFGVQVRAFERSPIVGALLLDAFERGKNSDELGETLRERFTLNIMDPLVATPSDIDTTNIDAIYIDPMYSTERRKALPRKEMTIFRDVVGEDRDSIDLLKWARERSERVVVKRSIKAPPLSEGVSNAFKGSTTRYDLYL